MHPKTHASAKMENCQKEPSLYSSLHIVRVELGDQFRSAFACEEADSPQDEARRETILVIDDNRYLRMLYGVELRAEGYNVLLAADTADALKETEEAHPDLVIMDVNTSRRESPDVTARLLDRISDVPVILNTAFDSPEASFMSWVADAHITKSSDLSELKGTIRGLLARSRKYQDGKVHAL